MKILGKYALREHLGPLVFALTALTSLLLLNYIAKNIGNLVGKGLPWSVIGEFVGLSVPFTFAMTLPMAVLVAVLYAFSRLAAENEITALKASGVPLSRLLVPTLIAAGALSLFMIAFNDQVLPRANHQLRTLMEDIARKKPTFALHAQVINEVSPGKLYLRAGQLDEATDRMREVVIYDMGDPTRRRTIYADSGRMGLSPEGDLMLLLYHGSIQDIQRANPAELQRIYYMVNHVRVHGVGNTLTRSTNDTYKSEREMSVCEMQQVVADAERADAEARQEIRHTLMNAVRVAATGASETPGAPPGAPTNPFRPPTGVGSMYCALLAKLDRHRASDSAAAADSARPIAPGLPAAAPPPTPAVQRAVAAAGAEHGGPPPSSAAAPTHGARSPALPSPGARSAPAQLPTVRPAAPSSAPQKPGNLTLATTATAHPPAGGPPSAGMGSAAAPPPPVVASNRAVLLPPPPPRTIAQVVPTAAVVTLNTLSASLDADRARIEDDRRTNATYDVEIQKKFAISVACAIFVLLGAPVALRFPRGGVGLVIGVSFAVFGLYYVGLIAGEPLAQNGTVSPFWAMWASNIIFLIFGLALLSRVGRAGSTSRGGELGELKDAIRAWWSNLRLGTRPTTLHAEQAS